MSYAPKWEKISPSLVISLDITHELKVYINFPRDFTDCCQMYNIQVSECVQEKLEIIFVEAAGKTECHHSLDNHGKLCHSMNLSF